MFTGVPERKERDIHNIWRGNGLNFYQPDERH